jgi:5-methylcytosine-specific restriction endonuclease McrA
MKSNISKNLLALIMERDSYTCVLCRDAATDCHHVLPRGRGGRSRPENLVGLCRFHHMQIHGDIYMPRKDLLELRFNLLEYICDLYPDEILDCHDQDVIDEL